MGGSKGLVDTLMALPIFQAEWVLWLLLLLSLISVAVMIERVLFFRSHRVDSESIRAELKKRLEANDFAGAAEYLRQFDSLETNVVLFGLREYEKGAEAVEELILGADSRERLRYGQRLGFLATVGSNAPFIGLFGTVLGIIRAFRDMSTDMSNASGSVMSGISEALVATAVGLLVAIPAVIAFNVFTAKVKERASNGDLLSRTLLARLKSNVQEGA
jgi:biopolymer transport protein ExbB/TolQ